MKYPFSVFKSDANYFSKARIDIFLKNVTLNAGVSTLTYAEVCTFGMKTK